MTNIFIFFVVVVVVVVGGGGGGVAGIVVVVAMRSTYTSRLKSLATDRRMTDKSFIKLDYFRLRVRIQLGY